MPDEYHTLRKERLCQDGEVPVAGPGCCEVPSDGPIRVVPGIWAYGLSGPGASSTGLVPLRWLASCRVTVLCTRKSTSGSPGASSPTA